MLYKTTSCENRSISPPRRTSNKPFKNTSLAQIHWSGDLQSQGQKYKKITTIYSFSNICSIKTKSYENKPTTPLRRSLYMLFKNTDPAQIHWFGDFRGQGQMYKKITTIHPLSKICSTKTTSCENKSSLPRWTLYMLFKNSNPAQIHWSGDLQGQGQM